VIAMRTVIDNIKGEKAAGIFAPRLPGSLKWVGAKMLLDPPAPVPEQ
jgi:hypothetical protein